MSNVKVNPEGTKVHPGISSDLVKQEGWRGKGKEGFGKEGKVLSHLRASSHGSLYT